MDEAKPKLFGETWMGAKPGFKVFIRGLPILPVKSSLINSAIFGAKIISIKGV